VQRGRATRDTAAHHRDVCLQVALQGLAWGRMRRRGGRVEGRSWGMVKAHLTTFEA
jgi:hypothetical protein